MKQKIVIEVESEKPLSSYDNGHLIVFNKDKNNYYVTSREDFLRAQNEEIEKIKKDQEDIRNSFNLFVKDMNFKYQNFLKNYQETNGKLIEMVKKIIVEE